MDLKKYLKDRSITHKEFGKEIGVSATCISNFANKERIPRLDVALRIRDKTNKKVALEDMI